MVNEIMLKLFRKSIWKSFVECKLTPNNVLNSEIKKIKIAIINTPSEGFGDIIFAQKITKYLKQWYDCEIKIFTTQAENHIKLGENKIS